MRSNIAENLCNVKKGLKGSNSRIIAVSKYVCADKIRDAFELGLRDFGESKVKDALAKKSELPFEVLREIEWHFIGHLQTNKVKNVVGEFSYIHSVDSFKLAASINKVASAKGVVQKVLLQVNVSQEESKYGFAKEELLGLFGDILRLDSLSVQGLMMMAPLSEDEKYLGELFSQLRGLKMKLEKKFKVDLPELSMGMSNDYKVALKEGSTMIRIGTKLFE